ncbi:sulfatase-like hydrolase/transferase [Escherichia coli]
MHCVIGKLDNTVVIITAGRGIPLSEDEETFRCRHGHLQVPLAIHWPGTPAQRINALTDHTDLMTTLMHACYMSAHLPANIRKATFVQPSTPSLLGYCSEYQMLGNYHPEKDAGAEQ